jgi:hypothetical protein
MERLTVCFGGNTKIISLGIQLWSRSMWSHVAILLPDGRIIESVGGIGVVSSSIESFKQRYRWWAIGQIPCENTLQAHAMAQEFVDRGVKYDDRLTFSQIIGLYLDDPEKLNCSEKVATVTGLFRTDQTHTLRPSDLWKMCRWVLESYTEKPSWRPAPVITEL